MPIYFRLIACLLCLSGTAIGQPTDDPAGPGRSLQSAAFGGGIMADGSALFWSLGEPATTMLQSGGSTLAQGFWQVAALPDGPKTVTKENTPFQITCIPNPVGSELTLQWSDAAKSLRTSLYDQSGRLLETTLVQGGTHRFDFSARPAGAYLLRLDGERGDQMQTFKLYKQR